MNIMNFLELELLWQFYFLLSSIQHSPCIKINQIFLLPHANKSPWYDHVHQSQHQTISEPEHTKHLQTINKVLLLESWTLNLWSCYPYTTEPNHFQWQENGSSKVTKATETKICQNTSHWISYWSDCWIEFDWEIKVLT